MKLWKMNKRSSTLADMSMNRVLLSELIAKGFGGYYCRFFGAAYRYLILESEHIRLASNGEIFPWNGLLVGLLRWSYSPLSLIDS